MELILVQNQHLRSIEHCRIPVHLPMHDSSEVKMITRGLHGIFSESIRPTHGLETDMWAQTQREDGVFLPMKSRVFHLPLGQ